MKEQKSMIVSIHLNGETTIFASIRGFEENAYWNFPIICRWINDWIIAVLKQIIQEDMDW
jgi:hypothetical protein